MTYYSKLYGNVRTTKVCFLKINLDIFEFINTILKKKNNLNATYIYGLTAHSSSHFYIVII